MPGLIVETDRGMYCPAGGFYIDPWRTDPSIRAIITHGHGDHMRFGCGHYLCTPTTAPILRARLGASTPHSTQAFGAAHAQRLGDVQVTFFPAGHVLGSAMVRVERVGGRADNAGGSEGGVWLVTGDYKLSDDGVSEAPQLTKCDTLVTESTFGLPIYRWKPQAEIMRDVNAWWRQCQEEKRTAVLFAYPLGKSQRVLGNVDPSIGPLMAHGAVLRICDAYREGGVNLPAIDRATRAEVRKAAKDGRGAFVVAPPSADGSAWLKGLGDVSRGFASGWMTIRGTRRRRSMDRGFALSDHVDWNELLTAVRETGASRVAVTHGYVTAVARWLRERGLESWVIKTHFEGEELGESESTAGEAAASASTTRAGGDEQSLLGGEAPSPVGEPEASERSNDADTDDPGTDRSAPGHGGGLV